MQHSIRTTGIYFTVTGLVGMILSGCDFGPDSDRQILTPINVVMLIDNGATATNDTMLHVEIFGTYISRMIVAADAGFSRAEWQDYDSLLSIPVPAREGIASVFGQFASEGGGTTAVVRDDIEIDLSARICDFEVSTISDILVAGDVVDFRVNTRESGRARISFGRHFSNMPMAEISRGNFSRSITIPGGIADDSVRTTATFSDFLGNVAEPVVSSHVISIRGEEMHPYLLGSTTIAGMRGADCLLSGNICFVSDQNAKIHLVDITDSSIPAYARTIETGGWAEGLDASARLLYVADGDAGVAIIGINPPGSATVIGRALVPGGVTDILVDGIYVYVSSRLSGLRVIDGNDWQRPDQIGSLRIGGYGEDLAKNDTILFISGEPSVACVDISDPSAPELLCEFPVEGDIVDEIYFEGKLYLATATRGILIYDVSDPRNPVFLYAHEQFTNSNSLLMIAPYLVISRGSVVTIVNGAVPEALPVLGYIGNLRGARGTQARGNELYIAGDDYFYTAKLHE